MQVFFSGLWELSKQEPLSPSEVGFHCHLVGDKGAASLSPAPETVKVTWKEAAKSDVNLKPY